MNNSFKFRTTFKKMLPEEKSAEIDGFLGNAAGVVRYDDNSNVYVILSNGQTMAPIRNTRVPNIPRLPVVLGYDPTNPKLLQVLRSRNVYAVPPYPDIPDHAQKTHQWPGHDTLWVRAEQFLPGLGVPTSGLVIQITGFAYYAMGWQLLNNQSIDMTSYVPGSGANFVLVQANTMGIITYVVGASVTSRDLLAYSDIPSPTTGYLSLFAVKVYAGQTIIINQNADTDIIDLRWGGFSSGGGDPFYTDQNILANQIFGG